MTISISGFMIFLGELKTHERSLLDPNYTRGQDPNTALDSFRILLRHCRKWAAPESGRVLRQLSDRGQKTFNTLSGRCEIWKWSEADAAVCSVHKATTSTCQSHFLSLSALVRTGWEEQEREGSTSLMHRRNPGLIGNEDENSVPQSAIGISKGAASAWLIDIYQECRSR